MSKKLFISREPLTIPVFKNKLLDRMTRTNHITPYLVYVPVVCFFLFRAFLVNDTPWREALAIFIPALVFWTLLEYFLHKFLFHYEGTSKSAKDFIYAIHGAHHDYPNDPYRLVVPLAVSIPALIIFYFLFRVIWTELYIDIFMASLVSIYLVYDTNHYMSHYGNWKNPYFQKMKKHHLRHHFSDSKKDFGFTTKLWDWVFRSLS